MCSCSSLDLLNYGCRCGRFILEESHIWFNGFVYMIGKNMAQINQLAALEVPKLPNFHIAMLLGDAFGWRMVEDNEILTLTFSDLTQNSMSAKSWSEFYTPGFLAAA